MKKSFIFLTKINLITLKCQKILFSRQFRWFHVILGNSLKYEKAEFLKYIKETKQVESFVVFLDFLNNKYFYYFF